MALRCERAHDGIEHYSMKISDSANEPMLTMVSPGTSHILPGPRLVSNFDHEYRPVGNARQYPAYAVRESATPERDEGNDHDRNFHRVEKKRRLTNEQVKSLEVSYEVQSKLEPERKNQLANELGLQPRQVAIWFQNRRARSKARQLERDYDILKMEYDAVVLEKDMLIAEVARLRHLLDPGKVDGASSRDRPSMMEHIQVSYAEVRNLLEQDDEIQEDQFGNPTAASHWQQSPSLQSEEAKSKHEITMRHRGSDVSSDSDQGDGRSCRLTPTLVENYIPEQFYQQAAAAKLSMAEMLYNDSHQFLHQIAMKMEEGFLQSPDLYRRDDLHTYEHEEGASILCFSYQQ